MTATPQWYCAGVRSQLKYAICSIPNCSFVPLAQELVWPIGMGISYTLSLPWNQNGEIQPKTDIIEATGFMNEGGGGTLKSHKPHLLKHGLTYQSLLGSTIHE